MNELKCQVFVGAVLGVAFVLAGWLGVTIALGAHPFWALQVVWIGLTTSLAGRVLLWPFRRWHVPVSGALAAGLLAAIALTVWGKDRFVSSYADDFVGGRLWYFGWMAIVGFAHALLWQVGAWVFCRSVASRCPN